MKRAFGTLLGLLIGSTIYAQPSAADYILLASSSALINISFELLKETVCEKTEDSAPCKERDNGGFTILAADLARQLPAIKQGKDALLIASTAFASERATSLITAAPLMVCRHYKADEQGKTLVRRVLRKHPRSAPYADRAPMIYAALEGALLGALSMFVADLTERIQHARTQKN